MPELKYVTKAEAIADGLERFNVAAAKLRGLPNHLADLVPAGADRERFRAAVERVIEGPCKLLAKHGKEFAKEIMAMPGIDPTDVE